MSNNEENAAGVNNVGTALNPFGAFDPEPDPECCGKRMEPQLAKARNKSGDTFLLAIWRCAACGRIIR